MPIAVGATIVTANADEFKRVPGLTVENWLALRHAAPAVEGYGLSWSCCPSPDLLRKSTSPRRGEVDEAHDGRTDSIKTHPTLEKYDRIDPETVSWRKK